MEVSYIDTSQLSRSPFEVKIIKVESPTLFWVQLKNGGPALRDLQEELNWWMSRRSKPLWGPHIKKGEPTAIFHQKQWKRGLIEEISGPDARVKIFLGDWGETIWRNPKDLYQLEDRFKDVNWQGLACGLEGVGSAEGVRWWPRQTQLLCQILMEDQEGTITIKGSLGPGKCLVTLSIRGGGLRLLGPIDMKRTLLDLGHVQDTGSLMTKVKPSVQ